MKRHKNLISGIISLILSGIFATSFFGVFASDFSLFMGFSAFPLFLTLGIGFLITWIFELFKKGEKAPVLWIIFSTCLIATVVIAVMGFYDLAFSDEAFFPGLFGLILFIFALPPLALATVIDLALIIIKKCKREINEKEDKNV